MVTLAAVVALVFVVAGFVKGVIGLGLPTVAVGLLGLVMSPVQAVTLLVVPSLVTNLWQLAAGPALMPLVQRLWPMLLGICAGTAGAAAVGLHAASGSGPLLGAALVAYALFGLANKSPALPARAEMWLAPLAGAATGAVTVATGVFVLPAVPYLQALQLGKDELVQALGLSFSVSTLAIAIVLAGDGGFHVSGVVASLLTLAPALAGMMLGQWVRARVPAPIFRRCFFIALFLLGAHLALRPAF